MITRNHDKKFESEVCSFLEYIMPYTVYPQKDLFDKDNKLIHKQEDVKEYNLYLTGHGFAYFRHGESDKWIVCELSDKGRKLKELGSIELFKQWQESEKLKEEKRQALQDKILEINVLSDKRETRMFILTSLIAVGTGVAAFYYLLEIRKDYNFNLNYFAWFTFGIVIGVLTMYIKPWLLISRNK